MVNNISRKLFSQRLEFIGTISSDALSVDQLQIAISYSLVNQGNVTGRIYGTKDIARKIEQFYEYKSTELRLEGEHFNQKIYSDSLILNRILLGSATPSSRTGGELHSVIAEIELWNLKIENRYEADDRTTRSISFLLNGPKQVWQVFQWRIHGLQGEVENDIRNSEIDLEVEPTVKILPRYFYDHLDDEEKVDISTNVYSLAIETKKSEDEFSEMDFLEYSRELVDDLTMLASFLTKHWVVWYGYYFDRNYGYDFFIRNSRPTHDVKINHYDWTIRPENIREFLKTGLKSFRQLRNKNIDLRMPINYYVSGHEGITIEEKFTKLFLSLEKIKDLFASQNDLIMNLPETKFKEIRKRLIQTLRNELDNPKELKKIKLKLMELNRPSLMYVLENLFSVYRITWKDIYPPHSKFTLLSTRNTLFHSASDMNIDELIKEFERLNVILDRLLLRMLGWENLSFVIPDYKLKFLVKAGKSH